MAFFNDLVRAIASAEGMDEMTVRGIGINVRDHGHIAKGGRGLSAAKMSARDACNLLIGVNASGSSKDAGKVVDAYSKLKLDRYSLLGDRVYGDLLALVKDSTCFGDLLESFIELAVPASSGADEFARMIGRNIKLSQRVESKMSSSSFDDILKVEFCFSKPDPIVDIVISDAYTDDQLALIKFMDSSFVNKFDRYDVTTISQATIRAVARAIAN